MSSSVTRVIVSVDAPPDESTLVLSLSYQDEADISIGDDAGGGDIIIIICIRSI